MQQNAHAYSAIINHLIYDSYQLFKNITKKFHKQTIS